MKICLVDNNSAHIQKVMDLLSGFSTEIYLQNRENFISSKVECYDLLVVAGSRDKALVRNIPLFARQIDFIKNTDMPFVGICIGFQMLCYSPACKIGRLKIKETGLVKLFVNEQNRYIVNDECYVFNHHRWTILSVGDELHNFASSENCIQFVKHKNKPHFGFQFHPEIRQPTNSGYEIFCNVLNDLS